MEFLVQIEIETPADMAASALAELQAAEAARAAELWERNELVRIWRVPGRRANWSLYRTDDATALHELLASLPLWPWMRIEVHPLALHPVEAANSRKSSGRKPGK